MKGGRQLYKCLDCKRQFVGGNRVDDETIITDYIDNKQTLRQLSDKYSLSVRTVWERLKNMRHVHMISKYRDVVINMDTTYWGRHFGLVLIKDAFRNKVLWHKFVRDEKVGDYLEGIGWLRANGFRIYGIVCDGMRGLFPALRSYRVQMCQYHMIQIVRRHLTSNPDLEASRELLDITGRLCRIPESDFRQSIDDWHRKWRGFLAEKSLGIDGKTHFTHPRPRAAYRSLKFYMPYLWTFARYPEICIPNTNAAIESLNQRLKTLLRNHSGISSQRRMKLLEEYIARHY